MTNEPKMKKSNGAFSVAVFDNEGTKQDGTKFQYESIVLQRGYNKGTDDKPEWVNEKINLRNSDLPKVAALLGKLYEDMSVKEQ